MNTETKAVREFTAPGRVNLIGEHTDYTGGLVLPMAIPFATTAALAPTAKGYRFVSRELPGERAETEQSIDMATGDWSDYPVGVLRELLALKITIPPFELTFTSDVPLSAGLSSSASIEVATAVALLNHAGATLSAPEIALLCQRAENQYVGSPCGIMDQFAVTAATAGHALLLNTRDLSYDQLPMNRGQLSECSVVVVNSMVKHSIASGDYRQRREELELGQSILCEQYPHVEDLGQARLDQLERIKDRMPMKSYRRCRHVITENERVREAASILNSDTGYAGSFGDVMIRSHESQRDDFEVSTPEIDFLVETALTLKGVFGSRLTGGGFGGCTVNLVYSDQTATFGQELQSAYRARYGIQPEIYTCQPADGALARLEAQ